MVLAKRIEELVKYSGLSIPKFAESVGFKTPQAVRELLKGNTKTLSEAAQIKILKAFPTLNNDWLLYGELPMFKEEGEGAATPIQANQQNVQLVPLLSLDVRGGFADNLVDGEEFTQRLIPWPGARTDDVAVEVSGDSMAPVIPSGSLLLIRRVPDWREFIEYNQLYVFELNDDRRILKNARKSSAGADYVRLVSYNPNTEDQDLPISIIRRVFKVIAHHSRYGF